MAGILLENTNIGFNLIIFKKLSKKDFLVTFLGWKCVHFGTREIAQWLRALAALT